MTCLSVNINKIATLRNSRGGDYPNVCNVAKDVQHFGAHGITVHPRPDERHIRYNDIYELKEIVYKEFNIEATVLRHLSGSKVRVYKMRPKKKRGHEHDKIKQFKGNEHTAFGSALHTVCEVIVQVPVHAHKQQSAAQLETPPWCLQSSQA